MVVISKTCCLFLCLTLWIYLRRYLNLIFCTIADIPQPSVTIDRVHDRSASISATQPHLPPIQTANTNDHQQQQQVQQQSQQQQSQQHHKVSDILRGTNSVSNTNNNTPTVDLTDSMASNKDLLALHNGAWGGPDSRDTSAVGQEKIIRAFGELMRNMARMKTFIRPSMCKPYGKQSESMQKSKHYYTI